MLLPLNLRVFPFLKCHQCTHHCTTFSTVKYGDNAPEAADLYFAYGKALLENAISQSSVLGKDQPEENIKGEQGM